MGLENFTTLLLFIMTIFSLINVALFLVGVKYSGYIRDFK